MTLAATQDLVRPHLRVIPNWPKDGVQFQDITTVLRVGQLYKATIQEMVKQINHLQVDKVVATEARGFLFGAPLAIALGAGFVPIRKSGKLPAQTVWMEAKLEYGVEELEMHVDGLSAEERVLVVDDVLATGGTADAMAQLVATVGAVVAGFEFFLEIEALKGRDRIADWAVPTLSFLQV